MNRNRSIKLRLFLTAAITTCIALTIAGFGLGILFERHAARRVNADLDVFVRRIAGHIEVSAENGEVTLQEPPRGGNRQRANTPYGGYYWQITENGKVIRTSRSLWDQTIAAPPSKPENGKETILYKAPGPRNANLLVHYRQVLLDRPDGEPTEIGVFAAVDDSAITGPRQEFMHDIFPSLSFLAIFLIGASAIQISYGLRPLETIRRKVNTIRSGEEQRLKGDFPAEVQPLTEEINALLDAQETALEKARNRASDLAHGLKTPLTALSGDVRRLREKGETEIASEIGQAVEMMNRHVKREMARARIRNTGALHASRIPLAETLVPLVETLRRTPRGEQLDWQMDIAEDLTIPMDRDDLIECMGNLMENASRYAGSRVVISASTRDRYILLGVDDDGPGLDDRECRNMLERGHRLDESGGAGLGLAIVQDMADAYDARLLLGRSPLGGLSAIIELPVEDSRTA